MNKGILSVLGVLAMFVVAGFLLMAVEGQYVRLGMELNPFISKYGRVMNVETQKELVSCVKEKNTIAHEMERRTDEFEGINGVYKAAVERLGAENEVMSNKIVELNKQLAAAEIKIAEMEAKRENGWKISETVVKTAEEISNIGSEAISYAKSLF